MCDVWRLYYYNIQCLLLPFREIAVTHAVRTEFEEDGRTKKCAAMATFGLLPGVKRCLAYDRAGHHSTDPYTLPTIKIARRNWQFLPYPICNRPRQAHTFTLQGTWRMIWRSVIMTMVTLHGRCCAGIEARFATSHCQRLMAWVSLCKQSIGESVTRHD